MEMDILDYDFLRTSGRVSFGNLPVQAPPKPGRTDLTKKHMNGPTLTKTLTAPHKTPPKPLGRRAQAKEENPDLGYKVIKLKSDDWLFTQLIAVSSCHIVDGFRIPSHMTQFVNHNHNAWSNDNLMKYYKTFIGAHNYYNHQQDARKSFGFVCDASIRRIEMPEQHDFVYYTDLLVATSRVSPYDPSVVQRMDEGRVNTWSVGCVSTSLQCSRCGHVSEDPKNDCQHMQWELGRKFLSPLGDISVTAAIVVPFFADGRDGKVEFTEMSMVDDPAFPGAVSCFRIDIPPASDMFFRIPNVAWDRKNPNANGVIHWHKKGLVEVVG